MYKLKKPASHIIFFILVVLMFQFLYGVIELDCAITEAQIDKNYIPITKAAVIMIMIWGTVDRSMKILGQLFEWIIRKLGKLVKYFKNKRPKQNVHP